MGEQTLMGRKKDVYVLAKILKWVTDSNAKSYQIKFAVNSVLANKSNISKEEVGTALQDVIHHPTIRDKFNSVHPDLRAEGIFKIELDDEGIRFLRQPSVGE